MGSTDMGSLLCGDFDRFGDLGSGNFGFQQRFTLGTDQREGHGAENQALALITVSASWTDDGWMHG
jgi:hypothetical protein